MAGALLIGRRQAMALGGLAGLSSVAGCDGGGEDGIVDVRGIVPRLAFAMTRARDGRAVSAADYAGGLALLTFGYTHCPDACPTTLNTLALVCDRLRPADRARTRILFVTVDPARDQPGVLAGYEAVFAGPVDALRGTPDELAILARRYRVAYGVRREAGGIKVSHTSTVIVFAPGGGGRLMLTGLGLPDADQAAVAAALGSVLRTA